MSESSTGRRGWRLARRLRTRQLPRSRVDPTHGAAVTIARHRNPAGPRAGAQSGMHASTGTAGRPHQHRRRGAAGRAVPSHTVHLHALHVRLACGDRSTRTAGRRRLPSAERGRHRHLWRGSTVDRDGDLRHRLGVEGAAGGPVCVAHNRGAGRRGDDVRGGDGGARRVREHDLHVLAVAVGIHPEIVNESWVKVEPDVLVAVPAPAYVPGPFDQVTQARTTGTPPPRSRWCPATAG